MSLEGFGAPVVVVSTDLAVVVDVQPVELIEPVRDRLEGTNSQHNPLDKQKMFPERGPTLPSQPSGRFLGL